MAEQKHIKIKISNLHLWTENPRDPINTQTTDFEIIKNAFKGEKKYKWELLKFMKKMGPYYDESELPTVVLVNGRYVVYDGNRRIAILKLLQNPQWEKEIGIQLPKNNKEELKQKTEILCNVCDEKTALLNVERKHSETGSWKQLERDYFAEIQKRADPTIFQIIDEETGLITAYPKINKRFVKEEFFTKNNLKEIGFAFKNRKMISNYNKKDAKEILIKSIKLINLGIVSTRKNRGEFFKPLIETFPELKTKIKKFDNKKKYESISKITEHESISKITENEKLTKTINRHEINFFGKDISLKPGKVNNLYIDIKKFNNYYEKNKDKLSDDFPALIRMSLRLLVETACKEIEKYLLEHFDEAKKTLSKNEKNFLYEQNIEKRKIIGLLQSGAHDYYSSGNYEQTKAMSLIIAKILKITHSKK